jgi:CheY-like chemotaxis protein
MTTDSLVAEALDQLSRLLGSRWIALACKGHEGEWQRHLGGRDPVLPQVEARFFRELEACGASPEARPEQWAAFLRRWKAGDGRYRWFDAAPGCPAYYVLLAPASDDTHRWPESAWTDLAFHLLASASIERERSLREIPQRQAVLESAFDLILATGEEELIPRWLGLARRITGAQGAAYYEATGGEYQARYIHATGELHGTLAQVGAQLRRLIDGVIAGKSQLPHTVLASDLSPGCHPASWHQAAILPFVMAEGTPGALLFLFTRESGPRELDLHTVTVFSRALKSRLDHLQLLSSLQSANRELAASQARLAETVRLEALGDVAAGVAHDVNNVLGALLGRVQLLQYSVADPAATAGLAKIEALIGDGEAIVRRLQEAARVETRVASNPQSLDRLARDVYINCEFALRQKAQINDRRHEWSTDFKPAGALPRASGRFAGALRGLLMALPDRLPADARIEVATGTREKASRLQVRVTWPPGTAESGLVSMPALTLLRSIAEELEMTFDASQTISGMTLEITLQASAPLPRTSLQASGAAGAGSHVLVVDDDDAVREVLEDLLRTGGHRVTSAKNGSDALDLVNRQEFDLVFTDLGMPGISGWELAAAIKEKSPRLPVVLVTGWGAQLDPEKLEGSGVDRILSKPFQWMAVLDTIQSLAGRAQAR